MPSTDSNTDIEVEFNAAGQAVFVTTGIHAGIDTVSKGCDNKGGVSIAMIPIFIGYLVDFLIIS